ncbi:winged helix DNA-binding protein [Sphingomonas lacunae]|uniref:Winged helix DNA-binding protein n=1 Tax=Sphingomonas lacunae TaxID=2698828 RepID=A0A6M4AZ37_9SPHN|nr:winged helix DNA-binding protein [Sphingomonas lacunae]QJQ32291.1 winged helix DNA-binding protein [Sphingomonas lacunae]
MDHLAHVHEEGAADIPIEDARRAALIRRFMAFRRQRNTVFPEASGTDANWLILVELYLAALERRRESISSLCVASGAPATTALRYIRTLTDAGIVVRDPDPEDGRRVFVNMQPASVAQMKQLFDGLEQQLVALLSA